MPLHKPRFGPGEFIILFVIGLLGLIIITGNYSRIIHALFSPTAVLIVVIMLVEYLMLKGSDRSEIYRREMEAARQKRRDDLLALRDMETRLIELRVRLETALEQAPDETNPLRETVATARDTAQQLQALVRDRI